MSGIRAVFDELRALGRAVRPCLRCGDSMERRAGSVGAFLEESIPVYVSSSIRLRVWVCPGCGEVELVEDRA